MALRTRLMLWYTLTLLAGFVVFGTAIRIAIANRLIANVDQGLQQRATGMATVVEQEGQHGSATLREELDEFTRAIPDGLFFFLWDGAGQRLLPHGSAAGPAIQACTELAGGKGSFRTVALGGTRYRALSSRLRGGGSAYRSCVASRLDGVDETLRTLDLWLLLLGPAVLILAALGGLWIGSHALRPVDAMTKAAQSISAEDLSGRLQVPPAADELQRLAKTWNEMLDRLEASFHRVTRFTADASHELRTPLAVIRATAELALRRERPAAEYRDALASIRGEAEEMTSIAEHLLALARLEAAPHELHCAPVDLNELSGAVTRELAPLAEDRDIRLFVEKTERPARVSGDAQALRRLLVILIENALQHTEPGGRITVRTLLAATAHGPGEATLTVEDSGAGIASADLPFIFDRFYRADPARVREDGAGLGLSIAQAIARAHDANLEVWSEIARGSRFWISFPTLE